MASYFDRRTCSKLKLFGKKELRKIFKPPQKNKNVSSLGYYVSRNF
jgi:hypothetical protein